MTVSAVREVAADRDCAGSPTASRQSAAGCSYRARPAEHHRPRRDPVRVVVADDAVILREGLARLLEEAGFEVVGLAADADELHAVVDRERPDVAIVDIRMPPTHTDEGLQAAKLIRERWPDTGILVLSQFVQARYAVELLARHRACRLPAQGPRLHVSTSSQRA